MTMYQMRSIYTEEWLDQVDGSNETRKDIHIKNQGRFVWTGNWFRECSRMRHGIFLLHIQGGVTVTYKYVWCDGLVVNDFDGCKGISRIKLYEAYNIMAWDDKVDKIWEKDA